MLFADVVRSMELAERLDADKLSEVMQGLFAVCQEAVQEFGGTVDKFTGDGVMALFGAPVAQEDHARRAAHAALALLERAQVYAAGLPEIELAVRVGLNSGEVVAGSVGEAFTAIGHTVGLAQRMESLAEPGTVRLSEHTAALLGSAFLLRDLGMAAVKGASTAIGSYALGAAAGPTAARRASGSARLVGRDVELALLMTALEAAQGGRGQVIGLLGEAGAGKSRLCEELALAAAARGVAVARTAGVSHAQAVPLLPILGLLRDMFGIADTDSAAEVRAKAAAAFLAIDPEFEADLALVFDFLEVPDPERPAPQLGPEARRRRVLEMFRRATARRGATQTRLLILEDLHWFDSHSVAFLQEWLPAFPATRTLVVTNSRPQFQAPWMNASSYRQVPLAPLDAAAVEELLAELLGADPSVATLTADLRTRAGGNPFFVEELVRGLAADGTLTGEPGSYRLTRASSQIRVPVSVQAVLAERIDRLAPREKIVLQAAAVIGRTFGESVLAAVADTEPDALRAVVRALCAAELLQETADEATLRFWHPLTHEVAYGTLLLASRRRLHARTAQAMIEVGEDRHDEIAPLVADHFAAAGDDLNAARWHLRAGHRAISSDSAEAQRRWRLTLAHLDEMEESAETLAWGARTRTCMARVGSRTGMELNECLHLVGEARRDATTLGDPGLLALVAVAEGVTRQMHGQMAEGLACFREAISQSNRSDERHVRAYARYAVVFGLASVGPMTEAAGTLAQLDEICGTDPMTGVDAVGYNVHDTGLVFGSRCSTAAGQLGEARAQQRRALEFYALRPMAEFHVWALAQSAHIANFTGAADDVDAAAGDAAAALALALDVNNVMCTIKAEQAAGLAALLQGDADTAAALLMQALDRGRTHGCVLDEGSALAYLARAQLALANPTAARERAAEAVEVARRQGARVIECHALLTQAQILRGTGDLAGARAAVDAGEALAAETGAATYAAFLAEERARLDEDPSALKACADGYDAIGATGHARRLREELTPEQSQVG